MSHVMLQPLSHCVNMTHDCMMPQKQPVAGGVWEFTFHNILPHLSLTKSYHALNRYQYNYI